MLDDDPGGAQYSQVFLSYCLLVWEFKMKQRTENPAQVWGCFDQRDIPC